MYRIYTTANDVTVITFCENEGLKTPQRPRPKELENGNGNGHDEASHRVKSADEGHSVLSKAGRGEGAYENINTLAKETGNTDKRSIGHRHKRR